MTSFKRIATRMGTTLSLIFRRLATKFLNLVQKKNPPGPAGPAKAGPLFRGSLVSFSDCSDSLRTRQLGVCVSCNRSRSFAGGSGARRGPNGLHQHPRILIPQVIFTAAHCLL